MAETVSRDVAASPAQVWAVLADISQLGEMSPECYECRWDPDQVPGVGATFTGSNRLGDKEWSNQATITEWVPESQLTWEVRLTGRASEMLGSEPFSRWGFAIEALPGGTRVTQSTTDLRSEQLKQVSLQFLPEVQDRRARNLETMSSTLESLARIVEQPSA